MTDAELQALARLWCRANGQAEVNVAKTMRRLERGEGGRLSIRDTFAVRLTIAVSLVSFFDRLRRIPLSSIGRIVHYYTRDSGPLAALVVGVRETGLDLDVHMNEQARAPAKLYADGEHITYGAYMQSILARIENVQNVPFRASGDASDADCWWCWPSSVPSLGQCSILCCRSTTPRSSFASSPTCCRSGEYRAEDNVKNPARR